jgi:pseudouridine-5'-phosphate glycosidase
MHVVHRTQGKPRRCVALETTLLLHGIPKSSAPALNAELTDICKQQGAVPTLVGVVAGVPIVGINDTELAELLSAWHVAKANTPNLGVLMHRQAHAATTVSATMELAAAAGVRVFATGGLGGVHKGLAHNWDVSADLQAFTRIPVAVVASGVKSLLDVESTREMLETLGVPVVGFRTDHFPAFYRRASRATVDARFDDERELAAYLDAELTRTNRGIVVCNPIPNEAEVDEHAWNGWLSKAEHQVAAANVSGRAVTPALLSALHEISEGATLRANLELVKSNVRLAATIASQW